jgi:hypothetical protein
MLRNVTASGVVAPLIIDIAQTLTDWADKVPVYVTTREDALQLLRNMLALHRHRMGKLATMRTIVDGQDMGARKVYPVDREYPMYQAYFDEWQLQISDFKVDPMAKAILKATEDVATQTRKTCRGDGARRAGHGPGAGVREQPDVRTQCQAGGMIAHRNNTESGSAGVRQGHPGRPVEDPDGPVGGRFCASVDRPAGLDGPQHLDGSTRPCSTTRSTSADPAGRAGDPDARPVDGARRPSRSRSTRWKQRGRAGASVGALP